MPKNPSAVVNSGSRKRTSLPMKSAAKRRNKKSLTEDEESDSSIEESPQVEGTRTPSPLPEEPSTKLPEELLKSFYKPPGVLMIAGLVTWDLVAKRENNPSKRSHPNLYTFHKFTDRRMAPHSPKKEKEKHELYRFIASHCSAGHSILISEEGEAYAFGRNNCGQLGFGDTNVRDIPEVIPDLQGKNIIHAAVGRHHTLFVTDTGTAYACGDNKSGQCGIGTTKAQVLKPTRVRHSGMPIVKVGCGAEFSMILDCDGNLHSFGLPEYGQLGHNTDGKYFLTSTKLSYHFEMTPKHVALFFEKSKDGHVTPVRDVDIVDFACGNNHTVAIDSNKRAFSWGFGGFGRLGHAEQKDERVPRLMRFFETQARGVRSVHCGATYSLAVNEHGMLYMFGQTKRTGEANMYPKPVQDLAGWNIRSVGTSNTSILIAADDSLIAWGVSPTYGELGMGEINKSSARPKEVSRMEGYNITQVSMGYSHSMILCDDSTEEVKEKLANMPTFNP